MHLDHVASWNLYSRAATDQETVTDSTATELNLWSTFIGDLGEPLEHSVFTDLPDEDDAIHDSHETMILDDL